MFELILKKSLHTTLGLQPQSSTGCPATQLKGKQESSFTEKDAPCKHEHVCSCESAHQRLCVRACESLCVCNER